MHMYMTRTKLKYFYKCFKKDNLKIILLPNNSRKVQWNLIIIWFLVFKPFSSSLQLWFYSSPEYGFVETESGGIYYSGVFQTQSNCMCMCGMVMCTLNGTNTCKSFTHNTDTRIYITDANTKSQVYTLYRQIQSHRCIYYIDEYKITGVYII